MHQFTQTQKDCFCRQSFGPLQLHTLENGTIALDVHWDSDCFETEQYGKVPYLDASASYQPELGRISINLINRHRTEALPVTVENQHGNLKSDGILFEITGEDPQVINDFDEENVKLVKRELEVPSNPFTVTLPPHSILWCRYTLGESIRFHVVVSWVKFGSVPAEDIMPFPRISKRYENDGTDTERPNLLYIHSDQHNPAVIGCYGDPLVQTPNLDSLAAQGVLFTNVYCPSPVCVPSRMSMLADGIHLRSRSWTNNHILDSGVPTLAHAMGAAGYYPVLIGRMHGLGPDQLHGYAERLVGDHGGNYPGSGEAPKNLRASLQKSGSGQSSYQVHDEDVTAATVNYLNRLGVQKRAGLPTEPFSPLGRLHAPPFAICGASGGL